MPLLSRAAMAQEEPQTPSWRGWAKTSARVAVEGNTKPAVVDSRANELPDGGPGRDGEDPRAVAARGSRG